MLNHKVKEYLDSLEKEFKFLRSEFMHHVANEATELMKEDKNFEKESENKAEVFAFYLEEGNPNGYKGWGTYYGPMRFWTDNSTKERKQSNEYPSINKIDQKMIQYWAKRAKEVVNPILLSRYADLVINFSPKISDRIADNDFFHKVIDSNIIICEKSLAAPLVRIMKAKRALDLAVTIIDKKRLTKIKDTIIKLERNIAEDDKPGLWGFAFRWLLLVYPEEVTLGDNERQELVNDVEEILKRIRGNSWLSKHARILLSEYYRRNNDRDNFMRVSYY